MTKPEGRTWVRGGDHLDPVGRDESRTEDRHRPPRPVERVGP
ncbi:MAG TPA: hypothetical protein VII46_05865 [Acidimicrobiales bacterium]